jgi:DNA-binding NarL/FixJ family response regulator
VLKHLAQGLTNKQIADELGISYETVKEHVQHILRKIGVTDRTQAAVWAVRSGVICGNRRVPRVLVTSLKFLYQGL